ncbi:MAG: sugar phosphorylase [Spirochaetes bacterium]|nr:sugar phosphorylase [Spirochaetota bacterium]
MNSQTQKEIYHSLKSKIEKLYGKERVAGIVNKIKTLMKKYKSPLIQTKDWVDEKDVFLIVYGDHLQSDQAHLKTLSFFLKQYLLNVITNVHILPFYPYSSDDGFSVIDYFKVDPALGDWSDIRQIAEDFHLMFDGVINHISAKSDWFIQYLSGAGDYQQYFIEMDPSIDLSSVVRPRALPLLNPFQTKGEKKHLWTTFSEDQIDLNYKSEEVFLKIVELLLFYISQGADAIRLDAIGYLWKEIGTSCIHLPQTHLVIQVFRDIFNLFAPYVKIITETNVPHKENISYFGNGYNEAQMVYQFTLPPLVLHAFLTENSQKLTGWASTIQPVSPKTTFFNFLASHDGIGVMPAQGYLSDKEIRAMGEEIKKRGGFVSDKTNSDGTKSPYEFNINYFAALSAEEDSEKLNIQKFITSQAILLTFQGVPAIYLHSLLGSKNDLAGVNKSGRYRSINREKLNLTQLEAELSDSQTERFRVFHRLKKIIEIRKNQKAFHPNSEQKILNISEKLFTIIRQTNDKKEIILALFSVNASNQVISLNLSEIVEDINLYTIEEIVSQKEIKTQLNSLSLSFNPYEFKWVKFSKI